MLKKTKRARIRSVPAGLLVILLLGNNFDLLADENAWNSLKLSTGVDYSSGDYGSSDDTDIWYVPNTLVAYECVIYPMRLERYWFLLSMIR